MKRFDIYGYKKGESVQSLDSVIHAKNLKDAIGKVKNIFKVSPNLVYIDIDRKGECLGRINNIKVLPSQEIPFDAEAYERRLKYMSFLRLVQEAQISELTARLNNVSREELIFLATKINIKVL